MREFCGVSMRLVTSDGCGHRVMASHLLAQRSPSATAPWQAPSFGPHLVTPLTKLWESSRYIMVYPGHSRSMVPLGGDDEWGPLRLIYERFGHLWLHHVDPCCTFGMAGMMSSSRSSPTLREDSPTYLIPLLGDNGARMGPGNQFAHLK